MKKASYLFLSASIILNLVLGFLYFDAVKRADSDEVTVLSASSTSTPSIYWGSFIKDSSGYAPWDTAVWDAFETSAGKKVSLLHFGQPWYVETDWPNGFYPFVPSNMDKIRNRGAIPVLDWSSFDYTKDANQPDFALAKIAQGDQYGMMDHGTFKSFDQYVTEFATASKNWGHPYFLRFDWEMNGWWQFPWATAADPGTGVVVNNNTPADYVAAWRRVHDIFTAVGANNVTWVWCPNVSSTQTVALSSLYPGDAYVDWTCLDGYNKEVNAWRSFSEVFSGGNWNGNKNSYQEVLAVAPNKPMMIGEFASSEDPNDSTKKATWITDAIGNQIVNNYSSIKAIMWFNWNAEAGSTWAIESSNNAKAAFASAISNPAFAANSFGNIANGKILPLSTSTPTDTTAPTVSLTYPVGTIAVKSGAKLTLTASASDTQSGISKVEFYVDNVLKCTDTSASYTCTQTFRAKVGTAFSITAKAYDNAGNVSVSAVAKVQIK